MSSLANTQNRQSLFLNRQKAATTKTIINKSVEPLSQQDYKKYLSEVLSPTDKSLQTIRKSTESVTETLETTNSLLESVLAPSLKGISKSLNDALNIFKAGFSSLASGTSSETNLDFSSLKKDFGLSITETSTLFKGILQDVRTSIDSLPTTIPVDVQIPELNQGKPSGETLAPVSQGDSQVLLDPLASLLEESHNLSETLNPIPRYLEEILSLSRKSLEQQQDLQDLAEEDSEARKRESDLAHISKTKESNFLKQQMSKSKESKGLSTLLPTSGVLGEAVDLFKELPNLASNLNPIKIASAFSPQMTKMLAPVSNGLAGLTQKFPNLSGFLTGGKQGASSGLAPKLGKASGVLAAGVGAYEAVGGMTDIFANLVESFHARTKEQEQAFLDKAFDSSTWSEAGGGLGMAVGGLLGGPLGAMFGQVLGRLGGWATSFLTRQLADSESWFNTVALPAVGDFFVKTIPNFFDTLGEKIFSLGLEGVQYLGSVFDGIKTKTLGVWSDIQSEFLEPIGSWFAEKYEATTAWALGVFDSFKQIPSKISDSFSTLSDSVTSTMQSARQKVSDFFKPMVDWFTELSDKISLNLFLPIERTVLSIRGGIYDFAKGFIEKLPGSGYLLSKLGIDSAIQGIELARVSLDEKTKAIQDRVSSVNLKAQEIRPEPTFAEIQSDGTSQTIESTQVELSKPAETQAPQAPVVINAPQETNILPPNTDQDPMLFAMNR